MSIQIKKKSFFILIQLEFNYSNQKIKFICSDKALPLSIIHENTIFLEVVV